MTLTLISAIFSLVGCPTTCDTGDSSCDTAKEGDADTDTDSDTDTGPGAFSVTANWDGSGLSLVIANGSYSEYLLGMAETSAAADGWYGESCIEGDEPMGYDDYGYDYCHDGVGETGITLGKADPYTADGVVENSTTLLTKSMADLGITYVLATIDTTGPCWVWGDEAAYYSSFGCESL